MICELQTLVRLILCLGCRSARTSPRQITRASGVGDSERNPSWQSWPEPDYRPGLSQLDTPARELSLEICIIPSEEARLAEAEIARESAELEAEVACNDRLAQVFAPRPELRAKLMEILKNNNSRDDRNLSLKVH